MRTLLDNDAGVLYNFFHITALCRKEFTDFMDDADSDAESDTHRANSNTTVTYRLIKKNMIIEMKC